MAASLEQVSKARQVKREADDIYERLKAYREKYAEADPETQKALEPMLRDMIDQSKRLYRLSSEMLE